MVPRFHMKQWNSPSKIHSMFCIKAGLSLICSTTYYVLFCALAIVMDLSVLCSFVLYAFWSASQWWWCLLIGSLAAWASSAAIVPMAVSQTGNKLTRSGEESDTVSASGQCNKYEPDGVRSSAGTPDTAPIELSVHCEKWLSQSLSYSVRFQRGGFRYLHIFAAMPVCIARALVNHTFRVPRGSKHSRTVHQ